MGKRDPKYKWTYCKDSLPPPDRYGETENYLLIDEDGYYTIGYYVFETEMWHGFSGWCDGNEIIAWMPLPNPPK